MEDLLDALYDNERPATPALTSLLLAATEQLEQLVGGTPPSELAHSLETTYSQFDAILPIVQAGGVVEAIGAGRSRRRATTATPASVEAASETTPPTRADARPRSLAELPSDTADRTPPNRAPRSPASPPPPARSASI